MDGHSTGRVDLSLLDVVLEFRRAIFEFYEEVRDKNRYSLLLLVCFVYNVSKWLDLL